MSRKLLFDLRLRSAAGTVVLNFGKATSAYLIDRDDRNPFTIRIYRKEEPVFVFGRDYMEYFDGINNDGASLIYEGQLKAADTRMYTYTDSTVNTGKTYIYWVSSDQGDTPIGPVPV